MNETKHTPGPWECVEYPNGQIEVIADGDVGGVVHRGQIFTEPDDIAEERANARLIAAAPKLLEACKDIECCIRQTLTDAAFGSQYKRTMYLTEVQAAIAETEQKRG
jgi:hypothetical protein